MHRALLVALALVATGAPAAAFHDPAPLLAEVAHEGAFWAAWRVGVAGAGETVSFELEPTSVDAAQVAYGLYLVRVGDGRALGFVIGTGDVPVTELHVDDDANGVHEDVPAMGGRTGATNGFATTSGDLAPGEYWLVVVDTAPSAGPSVARVFGTSGVSILGATEGSAGGLWRETDFEAPRNVQARAGAALVQAHVGAVEDGRIPFAAQHRLFGIYQGIGHQQGALAYAGPDGGRAGTTTYVFAGRPPGAYEFTLDGWLAAGAGFGSQGYVALLLADVELP